MTDKPVDLDGHRSVDARKATRLRRARLDRLEQDDEIRRLDQEELEDVLLGTPCDNLVDYATKAQYLIELYSETEDAQAPRRQALIKAVLDEGARLVESDNEAP